MDFLIIRAPPEQIEFPADKASDDSGVDVVPLTLSHTVPDCG